MEDCRLNDPSVLAAWLDGALENPSVREIDDHLLGGCPVCWSVLRFVGRLRELVGEKLGTPRPAGEANRPSIILDSEIMRLAMGLPRQGGQCREMLLEAGPWDAVIRIRNGTAGSGGTLELYAVHRQTHIPPTEALEVELRCGDEMLARAGTDRYGQAIIPFVCDDPAGLRLVLCGPGVTPTSIALA